jgi:hypothetical protein
MLQLSSLLRASGAQGFWSVLTKILAVTRFVAPPQIRYLCATADRVGNWHVNSYLWTIYVETSLPTEHRFLNSKHLRTQGHCSIKLIEHVPPGGVLFRSMSFPREREPLLQPSATNQIAERRESSPSSTNKFSAADLYWILAGTWSGVFLSALDG